MNKKTIIGLFLLFCLVIPLIIAFDAWVFGGKPEHYLIATITEVLTFGLGTLCGYLLKEKP